MDDYGKELIIDMHGCDPSLFTRKSIREYFKQICKLIGMKAEALHFWDDYGLSPEECQTEPHLKGTTAIQFILTSNITIHTLDILRSVYVNIFSCKDFDIVRAAKFTSAFFNAENIEWSVIPRK